MTKLYIGGIPHETDEMKLAELFGPFGQISTVKIVRDKITKTSKGFAFIEMLDYADARLAIKELNGTDLGGRQLTVKIADEKIHEASNDREKTGVVYKKVERPTGVTRKKRPRRSTN
jgi:RNA recognition motif-containing protein